MNDETVNLYGMTRRLMVVRSAALAALLASGIAIGD